MNRTITPLLALTLMLMVAACASQGSPRHSLAQLRSALLNHDADAALRYIDIDSVVDHMVQDLYMRYDARAGSAVEGLGIAVGKGIVTAILPAVKEQLRKQVVMAITSSDETGYFDYVRKGSVWYLTITEEGDTAVVGPRGKNRQIRLRMAKTGEGYWKIVQFIFADRS